MEEKHVQAIWNGKYKKITYDLVMDNTYYKMGPKNIYIKSQDPLTVL